MDSGVIGLCFGVFFPSFFFFFWLNAGVYLVTQWEAGGVDLDDGGCVGCVGSMREMTVVEPYALPIHPTTNW